MRVLFLGYADSPLLPFLREREETVVHASHKLDAAFLAEHRPDWIVSYNYGFIISKAMLEAVQGRAVNLHCSLLPWNRGTYPNLWAWVEGTPHGVTIHRIDPGVDTGDVYAQKEIVFTAEEAATLRTTHARLARELERLFVESWDAIKTGRLPPRPQTGLGTVHRDRDKARLEHLLPLGWDTPIAALAEVRSEIALGRDLWARYDAEIASTRA